MIDMINLTVDCLLILTTGAASGHFVNLSTMTYKYRYPPTALGNGPKMSSPTWQTVMRIGSFAASVQRVDLLGMKLACPASLYRFDGILEGCRSVKAMPKGFSDQRAGWSMVAALASMDLYE
jgi:hypothetical protein